MVKLNQLLRWKKEVELKYPDGSPIEDGDGNPVKVYIRVINDFDLQESYRLARVASSKKRAQLDDPTSDDYLAEIAPIEIATREQCLEIITSSANSVWFSQAISAVPRPDEIEMKEIAVDPDAPTLEEQEKLDAENIKQELEYQQKLIDYVKTKETELLNEVEPLSLEDLRKRAKESMRDIVPMSVFLDEIGLQKVWRAVYMDEALKIPAYDAKEEFEQTDPIIRQQLIEAYNLLELRSDDVKN